MQKLNKYLDQHKLVSGIDMSKQNFPDKAWLVLAISTLSGGKDEIFHPDYLPKTNQFKDSLGPKQVANSPMFEKVPRHL